MTLTPEQQQKKNILFLILGSFFLANAIVAEFIGAKIFSLEKTLGIKPFDVSLFGSEHLGFNLTAGVVLWPMVFVMTDIINEYFGKKGVRLFSYIAMGLIAYSFFMVFAAMNLEPADFWILKDTPQGVVNMPLAFNAVFGQGLWIICGSMVAFLIGQITDVTTFHWIKKRTGHKYMWLRSTGSTLVSQFIDSFVVLFIAFYIGNNWSLSLVLAIGVMNYLYKALVAVLLTPLIYLLHRVIDLWLGKELSERLMHEAHH